jgi:hypothetical protein
MSLFLVAPSASFLCRSLRQVLIPSSLPPRRPSAGPHAPLVHAREYLFSGSHPLACPYPLAHTHGSDLSLLLIGSPDRPFWRPPAPTLLPLVHGSQGGAIGFVRNYLQLHLCVSFPYFGFPMTFPSFIVLLSTLAKGQSIHNVR